MSYPVSVEIDYIESRSRLTTFFRLLLAIPVAIVGYVYIIGASLAVVVAWFALLVTGKWPAGLYDFTTKALRFNARYNGYTFLCFDAYPPFDLGEHEEYPMRVHFAPAQESYSRLLVFFRGLYAIPAMIAAYVLIIFFEILGLISWVVIVVTGKQQQGLQNGLVFCITYMVRAQALILLLTDKYPPFSPSSEAAPLTQG